MNQKELWRPIEGYPNYLISSLGRIFSYNRNREIKPTKKKGYHLVYLYNDIGRKSQLVHRLVARAFINNPENLPQINHKDENGYNNKVENLEWCTAKYNNNYGNHKRKMSEATKGSKNPFYGKRHTEEAKLKQREAKLGKPSKSKRPITIKGIYYNSIAEAMQKLNICTRKLYKLLQEEK